MTTMTRAEQIREELELMGEPWAALFVREGDTSPDDARVRLVVSQSRAIRELEAAHTPAAFRFARGRLLTTSYDLDKVVDP
jgi:hypothetical protein